MTAQAWNGRSSGANFKLRHYPYLICSTGRSGSTLLCSLLANTKIMGVPHEYFNLQTHGQPLIKRLNTSGKQRITMEEYLDAIIRHRTSENGVFGVKAHLNQCLPHYEQGLIKNYFGKMQHVFIRRRDMLDQAIPLAIASRSGSWTSHEKSHIEPEYSQEEIEKALAICAYQNYLWTHFFEVNDIAPCVVYYEDLLVHPESEIQRIVTFIGIPEKVSVSLENAGLRKQASRRNEEWKQRFNATLRIRI